MSYVLSRFDYPVNFGILLLSAFVVMMLSYLFLVSLREETDSVAAQTRRDLRYVLHAPRILRSERNFRNYLVADALLISAGMANAFFAVHALEKFSLPDAYAGTFTVAMMASMIIGSIVFGLLADRFGHKINMIISASATLIACCTAIAAPAVEMYIGVFVCSSVTVALASISRLPLIAELCPEAERPTSVALANLVTSPFVLFGIGGGWLANRLGYEWVFALSALFALGALLWLALQVREPRRSILIPIAAADSVQSIE